MVLLVGAYNPQLNIDGLGFFTPPNQAGLMLPFTKSLIFRVRSGLSNYRYTETGNTTANPGGKPSAGTYGYAYFFLV